MHTRKEVLVKVDWPFVPKFSKPVNDDPASPLEIKKSGRNEVNMSGPMSPSPNIDEFEPPCQAVLPSPRDRMTIDACIERRVNRR